MHGFVPPGRRYLAAVKCNIDDVARVVDGFITGPVLAATTRSRGERDLSASERASDAPCSVANNSVIAAAVRLMTVIR